MDENHRAGGEPHRDDPAHHLSPPHLTRLMLGGVGLASGSVSSFEVLDRKPAGAMGSVHSIALRYSDGSSGELPSRLVLKRTRSDVEFTSDEVRFYTELAPQLAPGTVPRCYGAEFDAAAAQYQLLLEDMSGSHECRLGPGLPPIGVEYVGQLMDCLAALHSSWWGRPLDGFGARANDPAGVTRRSMPWLAARYPQTRSRLGEALAPRHDALYRRYFAERAAALIARLEERRGFALLHGDAHVGNVLFPRSAGDGRPRLVDWSLVRTGPALWDVAFPLMWTAAECRSRAASHELLRRYHGELTRRGVDYAWETCQDDFRHALLDNLRTPVGQLVVPQVPLYVPQGAHLAAMELIEAWECAELLD